MIERERVAPMHEGVKESNLFQLPSMTALHAASVLFSNAMILLTDNAIIHLRQLLTSNNAEQGSGLRLQVEKGGCAGMQYAMKIDQPADCDQVFGQQDVCLIVDSESMKWLDGCTLDYVDALNDSGFKIENPNATRSCGCGTSFEPRTP